MKQIGVVQKLEILRFTSVGAYLNDVDETSETDVLLPSKYVPDSIEVGDYIEVFLYRDSEDRLVATTLTPYITLGGIERLKVVDLNNYGAFLDWGLEKDLFVPFKEQTGDIKKGDWIVVMLYKDLSDRLSATMRISSRLSENSPYSPSDWVEGTVYQVHPQIGAFIAVDNLYHGLVPLKECFETIEPGQKVKARVTHKKDDGKLDLSLKEKVSNQIYSDVDLIEMKLKDSDNQFLPFNDQTDPEVIKMQFNMSKRAFKRAVGVLLKSAKIELTDKGMKLK